MTAVRFDDDAAAGPAGPVGRAGRAASLTVRPQGLLLAFCSQFLADQPRPLFSGTLVEALTRTGVGEHAARTSLTRMSQRGLLERHRVRAKAYLSLTDRTKRMLRDGHTRVWVQGAVNRDWDGEWTLLSFSLPESRRADRHQLRKRLGWEGFGMLQSGLWITPSQVDVGRVLAGLGVAEKVKAFRVAALPFTDIQRLIADAWDLDALSASYSQFLDRWDGPAPRPEVTDDLARFLLLLTEWLLLVRIDPHLPVSLLPADWPAIPAERLVTRLRSEYEPAARRCFETFADWGPVLPIG